MRFLLTGATGFLGRQLLRRLIEQGHEVLAISRQEQPEIAELPKTSRLQWVQRDIRERILVEKGMDVAIHVAGLIGTAETPLSDYLEHNAIGTRNVLDAARRAGVSKFIYLSSLSIYGDIQSEVVDEDTPRSNPDFYGLTKYIGEELVREHATTMRTLCLRLPGILSKPECGPWLSQVLGRAQSGEPIEYFNPEAPFNSALDRDDLAEFIASLANREWMGHEVITLGASEAMPVRELLEFLLAQAGSISTLVEKPGQDSSFVISNEHAMASFGYEPRPIQEMVRRMVRSELQSSR